MQPWVSGGLQAEPFLFAATKIRIGRGSSLPRRALQAGNSSLLRRWCCCDSQIDPFKSRITAHWRAFPGKNLQRFASLGMKSRIDAAFGLFPEKTLHRFASLALKSRIDAHLWAFPGKTLHRFPSLALKSRITARRRANLGQSLQRFPSLTPEIKNHCSPGVVAVCRRNHSSLRQRKLESDAEDRCRYGRSRRNHSLCCDVD